MTRRRWLCFVLMMIGVLGLSPAHAETLAAALSKSRVDITSSYAGDDLILFGTIQQDGNAVSHSGYDLVVTVTGPQQSLVITRKRRRLGIWLNAESLTAERIPSYLAVMSNRAISDIAPAVNPEMPDADNWKLHVVVHNAESTELQLGKAFSEALTDYQTRSGLFRTGQSDVAFVAPALFRTSIPLPGNVSTGTYQVEIKAYRSGTLVGETRSKFEVRKSGFTQWVAIAAREQSLAYGFSVIALAALTGWLANRLFRRE